MDRLRTIFDGMFDGVWLIGSDGETTYVNEAMAGLLGTTPADMHGHPITEFLSEEFREVAEAMIQRQRKSPGERVDMRFLRSDGGDLWTLVAASPIVTADGMFVGSMLNVSDVTGKRAAQTQALQNQKLEAIGAFAAGITHDFNNLLTSIRGYAELVQAELELAQIPEVNPMRADLAQVIDSADRASAITGRLLAFTRGHPLQPMVVDPGRVLLDMLPMLRPLLSEDIEVVFDVAPNENWIRIDPVALDQVLINLAVNAQDAMPNGGTLTISLDEVEGRPPARARRRRAGAIRPDPRPGYGCRHGRGDAQPPVRPVLHDEGPRQGNRARSVDGVWPHQPIRRHGQCAKVRIGRGTTFSILLPKVAVGSEYQMAPVLPEPLDTGVGVVLMVEDEPSVREFARRVLARAGHTLITAATGDEALQAASEWDGSIDVLLTDIVMPGMHGQTLAAKLLKLRPDLRVVFMSGYAEDAIPPRDRLTMPASFLAKPFTAAALDQAIAREIAMARALREG